MGSAFEASGRLAAFGETVDVPGWRAERPEFPLPGDSDHGR
ncbi:hypothetical protein ACI2K4_35435 [Micromonospora sp. NPDC050397]